MLDQQDRLTSKLKMGIAEGDGTGWWLVAEQGGGHQWTAVANN
jgi:hypothetical protein